MEICGPHSGTGAGLLLELRFPLPIIIPLSALHSSTIRVDTMGPVVAAYQVGSVS
jgi:hypothetical protein